MTKIRLHDEVDSDSLRIDVGPIRPELPGPLKLELEVRGDIVRSAKVVTGWSYKGLERRMENSPWGVCVVYADRVDPEASAFSSLAFCLAVEKLLGLTVPVRVNSIRIVISELTRISNHLNYIARLGRLTGSDLVFHFALRERERILDLFELLTGARFCHCFIRPGGVRFDLTFGFIERVEKELAEITERLKEYSEIFLDHDVCRRRLVGLATVETADCIRSGMTGPNARASGFGLDLRVAQPYMGYAKFSIPDALEGVDWKTSGDSYSRLKQRVGEIRQSAKIVSQAIYHLGEGDTKSREWKIGEIVSPGVAYSKVEGARGILSCLVKSDGQANPQIVQFVSASSGVHLALESALVGTTVEDVYITIASFDLSIPELDR